MTNKFKYGEVVLIKNGKGKISNKLIKNKLGIVKEKEYYFNDYYIEVFFSKDDWFNEKNLTRAIERVNGKTKKYDVMIASTSYGISKIYENLKDISKDNKWDKINLRKFFSKGNISYCVLGWKNTYWPETNKSVMEINKTIKTFRANNIPYQYIIVGKNIDYVWKEEFIENDPNVDVLDISIGLKKLGGYYMIAEKILKIMEEVEPVIKLDENQYGVEKAIEVIHPLLVKNKVMVVPKKILNCSTSNSNKVAYIGMQYQFIDIESKGDKESIEIEILGGGYDETGARTIYNALSGAYRYALQQVFAFTVKDREEEKNNTNKDEGTPDGNVQNLVNKNVVEESEPKSVNELTNEEIDSLFNFDSEVA